MEGDGIRLTISLDETPLRAGRPAWIQSTVENVGSDRLFFADDCSLVGVSGSMDVARWRRGFAWAGQPRRWKEWALESRDLATGQVDIGFVPDAIARRGLGPAEYGCGDVFVRGELAPGRSRTERQVWSGWTTLSYAPPPTGLATLNGAFSFYWREAEGVEDPEGAFERRIEAALPVWIDGLPDAPLVQPVEAIDIALADPVMGPWLLSRPLANGADWSLRYDAVERTWRVGLTSYNPQSRTHVALIDGFTGRVLGYEGPTE